MLENLEGEATLPGADAEIETPAERVKSKRELDMEAIGIGRLKLLEEETGVKLTDTDEDSPNTEVKAQIETQLADTEPAVIEATADRRVRIKVDGVEQEVPLADVVRQFQKNSAADRRLEEATQLLKAARESVTQAITASAPEKPAVDPGAQGSEDVQAAVQDALASLFAGDETDAAAKLTQAIKNAQQQLQQPQVAPTLDVNEIVERVQQQQSVQAALNKVRTDYPELYNNRDLERLTYQKVLDKEAEGTSRADALLAAAQEVYALIGKTPAGDQAPTEKPAADTQREQKLALKANKDRIPTASVAAPNSQQEAAETPSSIIAQIAAKRLGQGLAR